MLDAVEITVKGGNGGHGLVSYHREKFVPQGGPDGGDGGRGGRVFLRAVDDVYTLELYRSRKRFQAAHGGNGGPNLRHGANGEDLYLEVPVGTVVHDADTGDLLADLAEVGQEVLVAHGGRGGWGNKRFATPTNQTPGYSQKGQEGEERRLRLELRLLADVGLIGLPNAGKSTLLAAVSNAKPKIASYPFTTLEPMLGVVNVGWERFTLADLPGLVEGASEGYGLGFEFLKHIRRCRVLLHVVSCESPDPVTDFELIEGELRAYDPGLAHVVRVVAVTKADLDHAAAARSAEALAAHLGRPVRVISAHDGTGLEPLKEELMALVAAERARAASQPPAEVPVIRPAPVDRFVVTIDEDGRYVVDGYTAVTFVKMMDTGMPGALDEVMRRLERWGIAKELRRLGIRPGDVVVFDDVEIAWEG
ncbi:GTPase ObgE [Tepidiforma sp.]|uniref:GTPase ObgE n=1 Tax=Tepidiforma sp. TaxID=2682230 RepID=UPI0021DDC08D|nr:GTPase ObgE [Tepidiforma sp.]MCX7618722.1 GTPase ObgE [Tepidiforma sp.]GIW17847.1 MAG: GTPase Obg [Tepidiforma sp.]